MNKAFEKMIKEQKELIALAKKENEEKQIFDKHPEIKEFIQGLEVAINRYEIRQHFEMTGSMF